MFPSKDDFALSGHADLEEGEYEEWRMGGAKRERGV